MKIELELNDEALTTIAEKVVEISGGGKPVKAVKKTSKKKADKKAVEVDRDGLIKACEELKDLSDKKTVKAVLSDFDFKSPKHIDDDKVDEVTTAIKAKIEELNGDNDTPDNADELEEVREAYQEYIDENSKKEGKAILNQYGIKKIGDIDKLDADDLEELLESLQD